MTREEFLIEFRKRGALLAPAPSRQNIATTGALLQGMQAAMLPTALSEFYAACGGIVHGAGYIFGPSEISRGTKHPVPTIIDINREMSHIPALHGKTIFGRNDLFFFAFDAFGISYMLDNLTLRPLRKYNDIYHAMTDCLAAGKL